MLTHYLKQKLSNYFLQCVRKNMFFDKQSIYKYAQSAKSQVVSETIYF